MEPINFIESTFEVVNYRNVCCGRNNTGGHNYRLVHQRETPCEFKFLKTMQNKRYFEGERNPRKKHTTMGLVSFVGTEDHMIGSQFFITLGTELTYLDEQHCVFGEVMEGLDVLELLNEVICDQDNRPYQDVRITHTVVLDDPFPDPEYLRVPTRSPSPTAERLQGGRIAPDEEIDETHGRSLEEVNEIVASIKKQKQEQPS
ncbi:Cyclophilin type peptidyl-prolyl cis-trans isomerase/CLD [Popillia japonica]|uniref:Cyclophilin type peptidyl-prolyl cis-trans isomerase/CLD n=1 Tax=Popillia japonica TaxID=7064 RepID=A0AAW1MS11_POPJA